MRARVLLPQQLLQTSSLLWHDDRFTLARDLYTARRRRRKPRKGRSLPTSMRLVPPWRHIAFLTELTMRGGGTMAALFHKRQPKRREMEVCMLRGAKLQRAGVR